MGLLIGIIRKRFLVQQKSNAAWKLQLITAAIAAAQNSASNLMQVGTDYKAESLIAKKLQERQYKLNSLETKLKQQKSALETQITEYDAEIKSCQEMINNNAQELFTYKAALPIEIPRASIVCLIIKAPVCFETPEGNFAINCFKTATLAGYSKSSCGEGA